MTKRIQTNQFEFRGFDDWVEIFRSGTHTSSNGITRTWSNDELDQVVTNHSANAVAPIVVGHPKVNDPAFGWTQDLKRDGDSLLAKFKDVSPAFAASVERGEYRKRSSRLYKKKDGTFALDHIGFLGAQRPAVELDGMNYSANDADEVFDFEADWYTPNVIARQMRRLREFLIEKFSLEEADKVLPDYDIDYLSEHANSLRDNDSDTPAAFSADPTLNDDSSTGDDDVNTFTQEQVDAQIAAAIATEQEKTGAVQAALDAEVGAKHKAEFSVFVDGLDCNPADKEGAAEFLSALAGLELQEFEFSAGGETKKQTLVDRAKAIFSALKPSVALGETNAGESLVGQIHSFNAPDRTQVDADRLVMHQKALDYVAQNKGVDYLDAVKIIEQQEG